MAHLCLFSGLKWITEYIMALRTIFGHFRTFWQRRFRVGAPDILILSVMGREMFQDKYGAVTITQRNRISNIEDKVLVMVYRGSKVANDRVDSEKELYTYIYVLGKMISVGKMSLSIIICY